MKLFAVVGHPLDHSLSPVLFNAAFHAMGIDAVYSKEDVKSTDLPQLIHKIRTGELSGLSITLPYKETIIQYIDELTPEAAAIGAVNTVYLSNGKVIGTNTDWIGFDMALRSHIDPTDKKILIYGAGGAARACIYALSRYSKHIYITNRTAEKGEALARATGCKYVDTTNLPNVDILVQTTSAGLDGQSGSLISEEYMKKVAFVFDVMYGNTDTVKMAQTIGIPAADGKDMLLYQAVKQFELFTGQKAPVEVMKKSLE